MFGMKYIFLLLFLAGCAHSQQKTEDPFEVMMKYTMVTFSKVPWIEPIVREINLGLVNNGTVHMAILIEGASEWEKSISNVMYALFLKAYRNPIIFSGFQIVERAEMDMVLKEHNLTYTGLIEGGAIES